MINDDTTQNTLAAGEAELPPPPDLPTFVVFRRSRLLVVVLGSFAALCIGAVVFVFAAPARWIGIDDYILAPGSATETSVSVTGTEVYPPELPISFTTVTIRREASIWDWWRAKHDSTMELTRPEDIDGDRTKDESRAVGQFQMDQSQDVATMVALQFMGYELVPEVDGAFVVLLSPDSPAEAVLHLGDLIVGVDDVEVKDPQDVSDAIGAKKPGDEVVLHVRRSASAPGGSGADPDAEELDVPVVLAEHPDKPGVGFLGVHIETPVKADAPFEVDIDAGRVRGPSAGLAFSLAVLDDLTPGELTGGKHVATTGTIDRYGWVGQVGGVPQKTEAAVDAGIEVFLVPPFEYADAFEAARGRLDVRCVQTFDDALLALGEYGGNGPQLAEQFHGEALEPSPNPVDPNDGRFTCAEAEAALDATDDLAAAE